MGKIQFKYHPNIYEDDVLVHKSGICQCCGKQISEYIEHIYSAEDVDCICLQCVSDGTAAQKFDAEFVSWAEPVSDPEKSDELFHRTPGYLGWQDENWLACCDDYCQYLGRVGIDELNDLGIKDEVLQEYLQEYHRNLYTSLFAWGRSDQGTINNRHKGISRNICSCRHLQWQFQSVVCAHVTHRQLLYK